jgi:N-acetylglucosaminyldiphosphoundecaprenol N-acetyl-beta-D-mannosaminyltransferase
MAHKNLSSIPAETPDQAPDDSSRDLTAEASERQLEFAAFRILGIRAQAITAQDLVAIISESVRTCRKYVVTNHNMHSLYLWHHDPRMRALDKKATFTHIDGMALIALSRLLGGRLKREHRTTYIDFWPLLADEAVRQGWRVYHLGSEPGVAEEGARRLRRRYPSLQIRTHDGFFDMNGPGNEVVLADIRAYAPHVLMVGMGMPLQEIWIDANLSQIEARSIFCVGCMMDYFSGRVPTCPRWLAGMGFEWLYRLLGEPARLWQRYLIEPWFLLGKLASAYFKFGRPANGSNSTFERGNS